MLVSRPAPHCDHDALAQAFFCTSMELHTQSPQSANCLPLIVDSRESQSLQMIRHTKSLGGIARMLIGSAISEPNPESDAIVPEALKAACCSEFQSRVKALGLHGFCAWRHPHLLCCRPHLLLVAASLV